MRKLAHFLWFSLLLVPDTAAQSLHTPAMILDIMDRSKIVYRMDQLKDEIPCPDRSENLNYLGYYRLPGDTSLLVSKYELSEAGQRNFNRGEAFFIGGKKDSALLYYKRALVTDPLYSNCMTYIGQVFDNLGNREEAINWYRKALAVNELDYMAHWFLADDLILDGETKEALEEICYAHILNRNNPRIYLSMEKIFKKAGKKLPDWCFVPQIRIESEDSQHIAIMYSDAWLGYALGKAVWNFEPGYKQSMGVGANMYSLTEELECIVLLYSGLETQKKKVRKRPEFQTLAEAIDRDMLTEYILYEIMLPEYPEIAYRLDSSLIASIRDYLLEIR